MGNVGQPVAIRDSSMRSRQEKAWRMLRQALCFQVSECSGLLLAALCEGPVVQETPALLINPAHPLVVPLAAGTPILGPFVVILDRLPVQRDPGEGLDFIRAARWACPERPGWPREIVLGEELDYVAPDRSVAET